VTHHHETGAGKGERQSPSYKQGRKKDYILPLRRGRRHDGNKEGKVREKEEKKGGLTLGSRLHVLLPKGLVSHDQSRSEGRGLLPARTNRGRKGRNVSVTHTEESSHPSSRLPPEREGGKDSPSISRRDHEGETSLGHGRVILNGSKEEK